MCNHIPNLRIWGDGRTILADYDQQTGLRTVYTGYLDSTQIAAALELLKNRGFFLPVAPKPANPSGTFFTLRVMLSSDPQDFYTRSDKTTYKKLVSSFDLSQFTVFAPSEALLVTSQFVRDKPDQEWPTRFGFSLTEADQGLWIQGEALDYLWQFVNEWSTYIPALRENGSFYSIALEIPGISALDPPFNCWDGLKSIKNQTPVR